MEKNRGSSDEGLLNTPSVTLGENTPSLNAVIDEKRKIIRHMSHRKKISGQEDNIETIAYLRIVPALTGHFKCLSILTDTSVLMQESLKNVATKTEFEFRRVFPAFSTQSEVFDDVVKPLIINLVKGKSSIVFSLGAKDKSQVHTLIGTEDDVGMVPRCVSLLKRSLSPTRIHSNRDSLRFPAERGHEVFLTVLEPNKETPEPIKVLSASHLISLTSKIGNSSVFALRISLEDCSITFASLNIINEGSNVLCDDSRSLKAYLTNDKEYPSTPFIFKLMNTKQALSTVSVITHVQSVSDDVNKVSLFLQFFSKTHQTAIEFSEQLESTEDDLSLSEECVSSSSEDDLIPENTQTVYEKESNEDCPSPPSKKQEEEAVPAPEVTDSISPKPTDLKVEDKISDLMKSAQEKILSSIKSLNETLKEPSNDDHMVEIKTDLEKEQQQMKDLISNHKSINEELAKQDEMISKLMKSCKYMSEVTKQLVSIHEYQFQNAKLENDTIKAKSESKIKEKAVKCAENDLCSKLLKQLDTAQTLASQFEDQAPAHN